MEVVVVEDGFVVVVLGTVVVVGAGTVVVVIPKGIVLLVVVGGSQGLGSEVAFVMTSWPVFVLLLPQPFSVMV